MASEVLLTPIVLAGPARSPLAMLSTSDMEISESPDVILDMVASQEAVGPLSIVVPHSKCACNNGFI